MSHKQASNIPWYCSERFQTLTKLLAVIILILCFINGVFNKHNDFRIHYHLGQFFIQKTVYNGDEFCTHYPTGRLLFDALFGVLPYRLSRGVWWVISLIVLFFSLRTWERLSQTQYRLPPPLTHAAWAFAIGISLRWLVRDLDDCGQQLLQLGLLTYAGWAFWQKREILTGCLLGAAVAYKLTPMLFLPLLLYKRRWKAALWMVGFVVIWNLVLPALYIGFPEAWRANKLFLAKSREIMEVSSEDPSDNGVEKANHRNRNLSLAIARYLQTYPPGHPLFIAATDDVDAPTNSESQPHPLFVQFLDLPASQAGVVIKVILLALALALAIRYRHPWNAQNKTTVDFPTEWAMAMALCALMSPLCWGQHMVLFIPLVYLITRGEIEQHRPKWRIITLWTATALILLPQREIFGQTLWLIIQSYKVETWGAVMLLILGYTLPREPALIGSDTSADNSSDNPQRPRG